MKALLINPPAPEGVRMVREGRCMQREGAWGATWPPISLAYIAAVLEKENFECRLHDCIVENINLEKLKDISKEFEPNIIFINTATPSIDFDIQAAESLKQENSSVKIILFGIHVTALAEEILKVHPLIDFLILGEPEIPAKEIALAIKENKNNYSDISGIAFKENNQIIQTQQKPIQNLDELPYPAWNLIKTNLYITPLVNRPFLMIATNRGCPHNCTYCADHVYYGKKLRYRDPKKIAEEMIWIKNTFKVYDFLFWSEGFTMNKDYAKKVCKAIIDTKEKFSFVCNGRIGDVDEELANLLKQAGCWMIGYGIESGVQEILNNVRKNITLQQTIETIKITKKAKIKVTGHFILGLPGDTKETIQQTIKFAKKLKIDYAQFYCSVPFPGSELYLDAKSKGYITNSDWKYFEQNYSILDYPNLKPDEVMKLRKKAYTSFYFRPSIFLSNVFSLRNFGQLKNLTKVGVSFLDWAKRQSIKP